MKAGKIILFSLYGLIVTGFCLHQNRSYHASLEEIKPYSHSYQQETETLAETERPVPAAESELPQETAAVTEIPETIPESSQPESLPPAVPETLPPPETEPVHFPLELNQASVEELCEIPEIGIVTAQKIADYREEHGGFLNRRQLMEISGIGEYTYQQILPYLYLETEYSLPEPEPEQEQETIPETVPEFPETESIPEESEIPELPELTEPPEETFPPEPPVINLNTADKEQLLLLPDCDEALADEILTLRDRDIHQFYHILEITLAEHVTTELFQKWEKYLAVDDDGSIQIPYIRPYGQSTENQD